MLGDVNCDGVVDIRDALILSQYYVQILPPEDVCCIECADVNCDGNITIVDALLIAQYVVGLISSFC